MDIPSLFMIPSAVSSGKVHSVFPNSTDADFDFNRDSDATRVNSEGLIERVGYYGSELITNGSFDTDSNWTKGTGWSISGGVASHTGSQSLIGQQNILTIGRIYKITFDLSGADGSNYARLLTSQYPNGANYTTNGRITVNTISNIDDFYIYGVGDISIDNVSVKEVLGDRARLNYEIEGGLVNTKPSLLLEPQSTNLITYSQDLSQLTNSNLTINSNSVISPDGTMNATRVVPTTNSAQHRFTPNTTVSTSTVYTGSIFAKADGYNRIKLVENATTGGSAGFDLQNGTILTTSGVTAKIEAFPNDWYRCSITETTASTSFRFDVIVMDDSSNLTFAGDGYSGVQLWGYQLEEQSYSTSYIPTNGSTQTRAGETCLGAGTSSILPSEEGILYAEIASLSNSGNYRLICLSDGTTSNRVFIGFRLDTGYIYYFVIVGGSTVASHITSTTSLNFSKVAVKWKANDFALWINGSEISTDTSGSSFSANTLSTINLNEGDGAGFDFYGKIRDIRVYNTKEMTDSEVDILLTKITS